MTDVEGLPTAGPTAREQILAGLFCCAVGLWLAVLPHLAWWRTLGGPTYFADQDDLLYLSVAGQAYANHPTRLGDPPYVAGGSSIYPGLQFVPGIVTARALGMGPAGIDLVWRITAGITVGLGTYLVIGHFLKRPAVAAVVAVLIFADAGFMYSSIFLRQLTVSARLLLGRPADLFESYPQILPQWRIITPGLSIVYLMLHIWLTSRARVRPSVPRLILSGLGFGLLFHIYFYYWTAAGLALGLAWLLDRGHRRVYLHTGWIGGLVGLPAVVAGYLMKRSTRPDWLLRTDNFLPIARHSELLFPKLAVALAVVTGVWAIARRRDLIALWSLACAGLLLTNHQLVTGLQIQNFHWFYVYGPCLSILVVLLLIDLLPPPATWGRPALLGLALLLAVDLVDASWLRFQEATQTRESVAIAESYRLYKDQRLSSAAPTLEANAVLAGEDSFVALAIALENQRPLVAYIALFSPTIGDDELDDRTALMAVLLGRTRAEFEAESGKSLDVGWGPWLRDPARRAARLAHLLECFDADAALPDDAIRRYNVRYVASRAPSIPPPGSGWTPIQDGPTWTIWHRAP